MITRHSFGSRGIIESVVHMGTGSKAAGSQCSPAGGREERVENGLYTSTYYPAAVMILIELPSFLWVSRLFTPQ